MTIQSLEIATRGEAFYDITNEVAEGLEALLAQQQDTTSSGVLHLFVTHTSCALVISEAYDPSAHQDVERFLRHLAPRDLPFIRHTLEGPDDSPSHMKAALLHQNLTLPVEKNNLLLGTWQGIYLAEFRDAPHQRTVLLKFMPDRP